MDTQSNSPEENKFKMSPEEKAEFKAFWEGETGKRYIERLTMTKDQLLDAAMRVTDKDYSLKCLYVADGVNSIIQDIKVTVEQISKGDKEEEPQTKPE